MPPVSVSNAVSLHRVLAARAAPRVLLGIPAVSYRPRAPVSARAASYEFDQETILDLDPGCAGDTSQQRTAVRARRAGPRLGELQRRRVCVLWTRARARFGAARRVEQ